MAFAPAAQAFAPAAQSEDFACARVFLLCHAQERWPAELTPGLYPPAYAVHAISSKRVHRAWADFARTVW